MISKRLNSAYHAEWAKAEVTAEKIAQLKTELSLKIASLANLNENAVAPHVATTQFFYSVGDFFNIDTRIVRLLSYGLLSFLLEISALGMISLVKDLKLKIDCRNEQPFSTENEANVYPYPNKKQQEQAIVLVKDILNGKTAPVVRDIRLRYQLDFRVIQQVMKGLYRLGVLCDGKRNGYELSPPINLSSNQ